MDIIIQNAVVLCNSGWEKGLRVLCKGGKISGILAEKDADCTNAQVFDAGGKYLVPGFIDMHFHGTRMKSVDGGADSLSELCDILPEFGVTGFLPTLCPAATPADDILRIKDLATVKSSLILGFMLEGHYLNLSGAISLAGRDMSIAHVIDFIESAGKYPAIFAVSPELEGIDKLLQHMTKNGSLPAFITHTKATAEQTERAIDLGARHATHFYDVFPYPGEKEPGVRGCGAVEAVMASNASVDFILDFEHVDEIALRMAIACKGIDKVCLITDANVCAGMPAGSYSGSFSDLDVYSDYEGGPARIAGSGFLAGSGLTMDRAVRNACKVKGVSREDAVRLASRNPAKVLGLSHCKGSIAVGYDADLTLLDEDFNVTACWSAGELKYNYNGKAR